MTPSVGRIVHVKQWSGECLPAIITHVRLDSGMRFVDLVVINAHWGNAVGGQVGVELGDEKGMWHWPERVEGDEIAVPRTFGEKKTIVVHAEEGSK